VDITYYEALRSTQPPIQWVPGNLSLGIKRPGREADRSPPSSTEVKEYLELYHHSPNMPSRELFLYLYFYIMIGCEFRWQDVHTDSVNLPFLVKSDARWRHVFNTWHSFTFIHLTCRFPILVCDTDFNFWGIDWTTGRERIFLSSLSHPDRFWSPPSLLSSGYWGLFPRNKAAGSWKLPFTSI